jgi:D-alanine-D-alanine ligase
MTKVIVLAGGSSDERDVSLRSGAAVAEALKAAGYEVNALDPADGLDNLLPELRKADIVFPALHGTGGEDGSLQKFLEDNDIKYVGSDRWASGLCFDKARYTELLNSHRILVPATELVNHDQFQRSFLRDKPFVLKPNDGGSSIDTFIIRDPDTADEIAITAAFTKHKTLLLQELIRGTEITVSILADQPLPVIEIIPPEGGEFDYANKYNGATQELCPPRHINQPVQEQAQALATKIHRLTGCRDMSRTDIIVTKNEKLYVLETNTIPGLTEQSLLPKAASQAGYGMPAMCVRLIRTSPEPDT